MRVLVVDDDDLVRTVAIDALERGILLSWRAFPQQGFSLSSWVRAFPSNVGKAPVIGHTLVQENETAVHIATAGLPPVLH